MTKYISAKEFRSRLPYVADDLKKWREIVVLKRSRPLFKVVPFEESPADLLERARSKEDAVQPELSEIADLVHAVRGVA